MNTNNETDIPTSSSGDLPIGSNHQPGYECPEYDNENEGNHIENEDEAAAIALEGENHDENDDIEGVEYDEYDTEPYDQHEQGTEYVGEVEPEERDVEQQDPTPEILEPLKQVIIDGSDDEEEDESLNKSLLEYDDHDYGQNASENRETASPTKDVFPIIEGIPETVPTEEPTPENSQSPSQTFESAQTPVYSQRIRTISSSSFSGPNSSRFQSPMSNMVQTPQSHQRPAILRHPISGPTGTMPKYAPTKPIRTGVGYTSGMPQSQPSGMPGGAVRSPYIPGATMIPVPYKAENAQPPHRTMSSSSRPIPPPPPPPHRAVPRTGDQPAAPSKAPFLVAARGNRILPRGTVGSASGGSTLATLKAAGSHLEKPEMPPRVIPVGYQSPKKVHFEASGEHGAAAMPQAPKIAQRPLPESGSRPPHRSPYQVHGVNTPPYQRTAPVTQQQTVYNNVPDMNNDMPENLMEEPHAEKEGITTEQPQDIIHSNGKVSYDNVDSRGVSLLANVAESSMHHEQLIRQRRVSASESFTRSSQPSLDPSTSPSAIQGTPRGRTRTNSHVMTNAPASYTPRAVYQTNNLITRNLPSTTPPEKDLSDSTRGRKPRKKEVKKRESRRGKEDYGSYVTRCICGTNFESTLTGETINMVECSKCRVWQHFICFDLDDDDVQGDYYCERCSPDKYMPLTPQQAQAKIYAITGKTLEKEKPVQAAKPSFNELGANTYTKRARGLLELMSPVRSKYSLPNTPLANAMYVAPNVKGLVTTATVEKDSVIMEIIGNICLPGECGRNDSSGTYKQHCILYDGLEKSEGDDDIICIDSRKQGSFGRDVRRSCNSNCVLRHILRDGQLQILIVARETIPENEEITIPFDRDFTYSTTVPPNFCGCSTSDGGYSCKLCPGYRGEGHKIKEKEEEPPKKEKNAGRSPRAAPKMASPPATVDISKPSKEEKSEEEIVEPPRRPERRTRTSSAASLPKEPIETPKTPRTRTVSNQPPQVSEPQSVSTERPKKSRKSESQQLAIQMEMSLPSERNKRVSREDRHIMQAVSIMSKDEKPKVTTPVEQTVKEGRQSDRLRSAAASSESNKRRSVPAKKSTKKEPPTIDEILEIYRNNYKDKKFYDLPKEYKRIENKSKPTPKSRRSQPEKKVQEEPTVPEKREKRKSATSLRSSQQDTPSTSYQTREKRKISASSSEQKAIESHDEPGIPDEPNKKKPKKGEVVGQLESLFGLSPKK